MWERKRKLRPGLTGNGFFRIKSKADGRGCPSHTSKIPRQQNPHDRLLHNYAVIGTFPAIFLRPIESEDDLAPDGERSGWQVEKVSAEPGVAGVGVLRSFPGVDTPVDECGI